MLLACERRVSPGSGVLGPIAVYGVVAEKGRVKGGCGRWMSSCLRDRLLLSADLVWA